MKRTPPNKTILGACTLAACVTSAFAVDLVNDTWKDATRTDPASPVYSEQGADSDLDGNLESAWYLSNGGTLITNLANGGNILSQPMPANGTSSAGMTTYFASNAPISLSAAGEKLRVTWKFYGQGWATDGNSSQNFRLCVVNTDESVTGRRTSDGQPSSGVYPGYAMFMNSTTNLGGGYFQLMRRDSTVTNNFLSSSSAWTSQANDQTGSAGIEGYLDGTNYTYVFEATLLSGGSLEIKSTMTGGNIGGVGQLSITYTDAAPATLDFDTFGIRPSNGNQTVTNLYSTSFLVEYIPAGCVPTAYNVTGSANVCAGGTSVVGLSGSDAGYDYHLLVNSTPTGSVLPGTGAALNFGAQFVGSYTVYASNTTIACEGLMDGSAEIVQYADPVVTADPSPASAVNTFGDTRVFSITATGPGLTYKWRKDGLEIGDTANRTGTSTDSLTMNNLAGSDSGYYDCIVSNSPCGAFTVSAGASLSVTAGSGLLFRSTGGGTATWSDPSSWEQSSNGTTWNPASTGPSNLDSNIVIRAGHTISVLSSQTADQLTVEAGGTLALQGGDLTINNGAGIDMNVLGTFEVGAGGGNLIIGSATLQFGNGGVFNYNNPNAVAAVPSATWLDGSTCRISQAAQGLASGIGGQNYYDFILDTTAAGQSGRIRMNIQANTQVRRDFTVKVPDDGGSSTTINNASGITLDVGRHVTFAAGTVSTNTGNKVLLHNASLPGFLFKIGGNFAATGFVDGFGSAETIFNFYGGGSHSLNMPIQPFIITSGSMNWLVDSGNTVALANNLDGFNSFTNKGTLTFGSNLIIRGTTLALDAGGTINANGTNTVVTNIASLVCGGTINLGTLPSFSGGESFQLIEAGAYSGSFGSIIPATPGGSFTWDTSQLNSAAILTVSSGLPAPENIVFNRSGNQVILSWTAGGWNLQAQTNSLSKGLSNNWVTITGATSPYTNTISPGNPAVFYRLSAP